MIERAKCIINECLSAYYKKTVQADFSHLDRVHLCGESFEYEKKTYQVDLYANLLDFTLVATVNGWTVCTFGVASDSKSESTDKPENFLLMLPRLDLHGILKDCVKITKGDITDDRLEEDRGVEAVRLAWLVVNEYTISDLIEALERHRLISNKADIPSIFEEWEEAEGFDGDIWPLPPEPADRDADDDDDFWEEVDDRVHEILDVIEDYHEAPDPEAPDFNASSILVTEDLLSDGSDCIVLADAIHETITFNVGEDKSLYIWYKDFDVLLSDLTELLDTCDVELFYELFRERSTTHIKAGITHMHYHDDRVSGEDLEEDEDNEDEDDHSDCFEDSSEEGMSSRLKTILPYVEKANGLCGFCQLDLENLNPKRVILLDGTFADGLRYTVSVNLSDCSIISELPEWGECNRTTFGVYKFGEMQAYLAQITPEWAEKNEDNWRAHIQSAIEHQKQQDANVYAYENDPEYRSAADAIEARLNSIAAANMRRSPNGDTITDEVGSSYGEVVMVPHPRHTYIEMTPDDLIAIGTEMKRASKRCRVEFCVVDTENIDGERGDVPGIFIHIPADIKEDAPAEPDPESAESTET